MAQISLTINGRPYQVTCDDGQEAHLHSLGDFLDRKVQDLAKTVGQVGDSRLLVMAGLLVADELFEALQQLDKIDAETGRPAGPRAAAGPNAASTLEACARRIEDIAARLERA